MTRVGSRLQSASTRTSSHSCSLNFHRAIMLRCLSHRKSPHLITISWRHFFEPTSDVLSNWNNSFNASTAPGTCHVCFRHSAGSVTQFGVRNEKQKRVKVGPDKFEVQISENCLFFSHLMPHIMNSLFSTSNQHKHQAPTTHQHMHAQRCHGPPNQPYI